MQDDSEKLRQPGRDSTTSGTGSPTGGADGATDTLRTFSAKWEASRPSRELQPRTSQTVGTGTSDTNLGTLPVTSRDSGPWLNNIAHLMNRELRIMHGGELVTQSFDGSDESIRNERMNRAFREAGLPPLHVQQSKAGLSRPSEWTDALTKVVKVILRDGMCALIGSPGSGKTQIAVEVAKAHLRSVLRVRAIRYEPLADAFSICNEANGAGATRTEMAILREFTDPGLLILDDIDKVRGGDLTQRLTDKQRELLFRIGDKRYRSGLPILFIGNLDTADDLQALLDGFRGGGERVGPLFDRLRQTGGIVTAFGWNFRGGDNV